MKRRLLIGVLAAALILFLWPGGRRTDRVLPAPGSGAKYLVILIGDGMGAKHIEAAERYQGRPSPFALWPRTWAATFPARGSYDPSLAWSDFDYLKEGVTDSAAAATAIYTGHKTANGRISVSLDGSERLLSISEIARDRGLAAGAVTSVEISDATPGAWMAHNDRRADGFAIADEGLWGDPLATGTPADSPYYGGSHGPTRPALDLLLGAGNPRWYGGHFVNRAIRDKLAGDSGRPGAFTYIERRAGLDFASARLAALAAKSEVTRLAGLYGGRQGHLEYRLADGSGADPEEPTLTGMTRAALRVLDRRPAGFVLMVEGGSIDLASHDGRMDEMLGEVFDFFGAVEAVKDWVDDPTNDSTWDNTLVLVTADHETGYLSAGYEVFPDRPLGTVGPRTLTLEKLMAGTGLRASWEDSDHNDRIDPGEPVYWCWNATGHSNSLVPLFARGAGESLLGAFVSGLDPVRGRYLQNTDIFTICEYVLKPAGGRSP